MSDIILIYDKLLEHPLSLVTVSFFILLLILRGIKRDFVKRNRLLVNTVFSFTLLISLGILAAIFPELAMAFDYIEDELSLSFDKLLFLMAVLFSPLWATKIFNQVRETVFLNKANSLYIEIVKALNDNEEKKSVKPKNLISSLQASIIQYCRNDEKAIDRMRHLLFNFLFMDLREANLSRAQLSGTDLRYSDLSGAKLGGANLESSRLSGTSLDDAQLDRAILDYAMLSPSSLRKITMERLCTIRSAKGLILCTKYENVIDDSHAIPINIDLIQALDLAVYDDFLLENRAMVTKGLIKALVHKHKLQAKKAKANQKRKLREENLGHPR